MNNNNIPHDSLPDCACCKKSFSIVDRDSDDPRFCEGCIVAFDEIEAADNDGYITREKYDEAT